MGEFKAGQRVKVEYEGTVVVVHHEPKLAYVIQRGGRNAWMYPEHSTITLLDPADWPPQVGDIWEANGQEWFACRRHDDGALLIKPDDGGGMWDTKTFKSLNPVLVRRRG